jgi:predicted AlkP superfamily pyrophosphatase or phosphodiesterase
MINTLSAPPAFSSPTSTTVAREVSLITASYPNIGNKITQLWGSVDLSTYLNSVIFDERGNRHGFPEAIISALFRVLEVQRTIKPEARNGDIWDVILERIE